MGKRSTETITEEQTGTVSGEVGEPLEKADRSEFSGQNMNEGFLPYWEPDVGQEFVATVSGFDLKDPDFQRITFTAEEDVVCYTGPVENQERVIVRKGEQFNTSLYASLRITPAFLNFTFLVRVKSKEKVKSDPKKSVFLWDLLPRPKDVPAIKAAKSTYAAQLAAAEMQAKAIAQATAQGTAAGNGLARPAARA